MFKLLRWIRTLSVTIYDNKVRDFFANERRKTEALVTGCYENPSYYLAYIVQTLTTTFTASINLIFSAIYMISSRIHNNGGNEYRLIYLNIDEKLNYKVISFGMLLSVFIIYGFLYRLLTISVKVKRMRENSILRDDQ